jgi:uncharacterized protein (DUF1015 family)
MAGIRPFRGVRYDPAHVPDLSRAVTQPYDKITGELQTSYYEQSPYNYVRLILGRREPGDDELHNVYTRARDAYADWRKQGVLAQEAQPALYVYQQTYTLPDGRMRTRKAFLAALQLTPFEEGTVLPHERTLSGPKQDRLNLFRATGVNFEPVFLLYPDPDNRINSLLDAAVADRAPDADVHELYEQDVRQQMWVITDPALVEQVVAEMAPKRRLIIADGHHRYETALNYREERHAQAGTTGHGGPTPYDYALAALVSMEDPGLTILPTHRLVHSYTKMSAATLLDRAAEYFDIRPMPNRAALAAAMREHQTTGQADVAFGFDTGTQQSLWTLRDLAVMDELAPDRGPSWRQLDVSVLHELVLERLLGLTKDSITRQENLQYLREPEPGYTALDRGEAQFLFLLNPTRMSQVAACAEAGEKMPQKSTDFYPKMISGLVLYPLS